MRVLLTGASGFIGRHLAEALSRHGHAVVRTTRQPGDVDGEASVDVDFTRASEVADWLPGLRDIEAVVNAVGILRERGPQTFAAVHVQAPCALFDACVIAGITSVLDDCAPLARLRTGRPERAIFYPSCEPPPDPVARARVSGRTAHTHR